MPTAEVSRLQRTIDMFDAISAIADEARAAKSPTPNHKDSSMPKSTHATEFYKQVMANYAKIRGINKEARDSAETLAKAVGLARGTSCCLVNGEATLFVARDQLGNVTVTPTKLVYLEDLTAPVDWGS